MQRVQFATNPRFRKSKFLLGENLFARYADDVDDNGWQTEKSENEKAILTELLMEG